MQSLISNRNEYCVWYIYILMLYELVHDSWYNIGGFGEMKVSWPTAQWLDAISPHTAVAWTSRFFDLLELALRTQPRSLQLHCSSLNRISQGKEMKESVAATLCASLWFAVADSADIMYSVPSCHVHSWYLLVLCFTVLRMPIMTRIERGRSALFHWGWLNSYPGKE